MLNLNDPKSEIIFKASAYIDKIKMACGTFPLQDFEARQLTFLNIKILCEEFIAFCRANYDTDIEEMVSTIGDIKREAELLENINRETEEGNCKVCNGKLWHYDSLVKEFGIIYNCNYCSGQIYNYCNDLEMYTGTWMI